jgi:hypothetical protein
MQAGSPVRPRLPSVGLSALGLSALLLACSAGGGDDGFDFSTETNGLGTAAPTGGTTEATQGSESSAGTTAMADSGTGTDGASESSTGESPPAVPCTGVDLVFVVDNSEPMLEEQQRLRTAALGFVQAIVAGIPTLVGDVRVGVITTDDDQFVQANEVACGPFEGGNTWMLASSTVLATELDCALSVGIAGSPNERPMDMLFGSLSDENLMPGGFHGGFLREDALLVVVLVTNEEDDLELDTAWGSAGDPADWAQALAGRKGGWAQDVVVLSLLGIEEPNACPLPWDGLEGAQPSPRLVELTESFPQGAVGDICAEDYAAFLLGVVPGVSAACANYTPP